LQAHIRAEEAISEMEGQDVEVVQKMTAGELKTRLLKMAQAYKGKKA
jgi:hypothetical protein